MARKKRKNTHMNIEKSMTKTLTAKTPVAYNKHYNAWYITMGQAGFNSPANNAFGYATEAKALAAIRHYSSKKENTMKTKITKRWRTSWAGCSQLLNTPNLLKPYRGEVCSTAPRFTGRPYFIVEATGTVKQMEILEGILSKINVKFRPTSEKYWDGLNWRQAI